MYTVGGELSAKMGGSPQGKDPDPDLWLKDPDPDPGGPKTCGA